MGVEGLRTEGRGGGTGDKQEMKERVREPERMEAWKEGQVCPIALIVGCVTRQLVSHDSWVFSLLRPLRCLWTWQLVCPSCCQ